MVNFFLNWMCKKLISNPDFNEFINMKLINFYKKDTLHLYRVWGDESKLKIGKNVHINNAIFNTVSGNIEIEDYTFLGHNVNLLTGTHNIFLTDEKRQQDVPEKGRDIIIGRGVWIASNAIIYGPCIIGENAVIGAGSIVTGKIEANSLYANDLAKKIKELK